MGQNVIDGTLFCLHINCINRPLWWSSYRPLSMRSQISNELAVESDTVSVRPCEEKNWTLAAGVATEKLLIMSRITMPLGKGIFGNESSAKYTSGMANSTLLIRKIISSPTIVLLNCRFKTKITLS